MHCVTLSQHRIELSPLIMAPNDPAGIGPAETLSFLYRIESTARNMANRPTVDPNRLVSPEERRAWGNIECLSNLMHVEFSAILKDSYDPRRHIALLVTIVRLHDYDHICRLIGVRVPPVVDMSHNAQRQGLDLSRLPWNSQADGTWLEALPHGPPEPRQLPPGIQLASAGSQQLPSVSQLFPAGVQHSPPAPSFPSTNPASHVIAPIEAHAASSQQQGSRLQTSIPSTGSTIQRQTSKSRRAKKTTKQAKDVP